VFRSLEIGDVPKVPLPFPDTVVGTYSCHGIEPSYMDSKPFVAKINQDRYYHSTKRRLGRRRRRAGLLDCRPLALC
jgi:hypothetical protein